MVIVIVAVVGGGRGAHRDQQVGRADNAVRLVFGDSRNAVLADVAGVCPGQLDRLVKAIGQSQCGIGVVGDQ